jgi:hypothetical protein
LGWSHEKYLYSSVYEFNEASKGYWRKWERKVWNVREIIWEMNRGNPHYKDEGRYKRKQDIFKLSMDEEEKKEVKRPTIDEVKIFELFPRFADSCERR